MQITSCVGICGMLEVCYRSNIVFMVMADSDIYIVLAKQLVRVTFWCGLRLTLLARTHASRLLFPKRQPNHRPAVTVCAAESTRSSGMSGTSCVTHMIYRWQYIRQRCSLSSMKNWRASFGTFSLLPICTIDQRMGWPFLIKKRSKFTSLSPTPKGFAIARSNDKIN